MTGRLFGLNRVAFVVAGTLGASCILLYALGPLAGAITGTTPPDLNSKIANPMPWGGGDSCLGGDMTDDGETLRQLVSAIKGTGSWEGEAPSSFIYRVSYTDQLSGEALHTAVEVTPTSVPGCLMVTGVSQNGQRIDPDRFVQETAISAVVPNLNPDNATQN